MKAGRRKVKREAAAQPAAPPAVPPSKGPPWRRHAIPLLVLWACTLMAYSDSFHSGLVFDNKVLIGEDPRITAATPENLNLILTKEYWYPSSGDRLYRPLTTLSYLFNYVTLGNGKSPAGYHVANWLLHAINASLVYGLALLLFGEAVPALAMAAIWALHPVLTESVTNVAGRADLLAGFGVLAGLLCYIRGTASQGRQRFLWLASAALAVAIGMFSKESAIVVLAAVVLYDLAWGTAVGWRARAAGYGALLGPCLLYLAARSSVLASSAAAHFPFTDNPLVGAGFFPARLTAIEVIGKYLALLVWPGRLSCDYSYNQIPLFAGRLDHLQDWKALAALLVCLGAAAVAIRCYRRNPPVFFLIAFFFAALAPTANLALSIGTIMAERFLYLPAIGFAGCLVVAALVLFRRVDGRRPAGHPALTGMLALIAVAFGVRTFARNLDWKDERSLWSSAVAASPASYKTHMALALAQADGGLEEMDQALAILKDLPDELNTPVPYIDAGQMFREHGSRLLGNAPGSARVATLESYYWHQRALEVLLRAERIQAANNQKTRREDLANGRNPVLLGRYQLYEELGRTYIRLAELGKAVEAFETARRLRIKPELFEELSIAHFLMGDRRAAAISLMEGLVVDPRNTRIAAELADLYRQIDPQGCGNSPALNLGCPLVQEHACEAGRNMARLFEEGGQEQAAAQVRGNARNLGCPVQK